MMKNTTLRKNQNDSQKKYAFTPVKNKDISIYGTSIRFITLEIDRIEELNLCLNGPSAFAQLQHGMKQATAPNYIRGFFKYLRKGFATRTKDSILG